MGRYLLALDPSVRSPGFALFRDGVLERAQRTIVKSSSTAVQNGSQLGPSEFSRWQYVAQVITDQLPDVIHTVVFELPQIYTWGKGKGDPNQLLALAGIGAIVAAHYKTFTLSPRPAEWIGQVPKSTKGSALSSPRALKILSRLSVDERTLVPDSHDAIDAVGLGLWALQRLAPKKVLTSGSGTPTTPGTHTTPRTRTRPRSRVP